ncbi:MAG: hypothetical protein Q9165_007176 [Trypethelium subeluteriae]
MTVLLEGTAFITGAASGIGRATAFAFAKYGAQKLALADVNLDGLAQTASELKSHDSRLNIIYFHVDVTEEGSIENAIAKTVDRHGRVDFAVNCAGVGGPAGLSPNIAVADWKKLLDINLTGVWTCQKHELAQMMKQDVVGPRQGRGCIVNVASMYGTIGTSLNTPAAAYAASKHGVLGLTKTDALHFAKDGIRINAICPGYVATPLVQGIIPDELMQKEYDKTPMGRPAEPEEIADSIIYLASPMSSFMTGSGLVIDGGFTAH